MVESMSLDEDTALLRRLLLEAPIDILHEIMKHAAPSIPSQGKAKRELSRKGIPFTPLTHANKNTLRATCTHFRDAVDASVTSLMWIPMTGLPNDTVVSLPNVSRIDPIRIKVLLCPHLVSLRSLEFAPASLEEVDIAGCHQITSLEPLSGCRLRKLDASHTTIADLSPLCASSLTLTVLDVNNTKVITLSPLATCINLKALDCSNTSIDDLSPLKDCSSLEVLHIYSTKIRSCLPLVNCSKLKELWPDRGIQDLELLRQVLPECQM